MTLDRAPSCTWGAFLITLAAYRQRTLRNGMEPAGPRLGLAPIARLTRWRSMTAAQVRLSMLAVPLAPLEGSRRSTSPSGMEVLGRGWGSLMTPCMRSRCMTMGWGEVLRSIWAGRLTMLEEFRHGELRDGMGMHGSHSARE